MRRNAAGAITGGRLLPAVETIGGGLVTQALAFAATLVVLLVALTSLVGVGLLAWPATAALLRRVGTLERSRLARAGVTVVSPYGLAPASRSPVRGTARTAVLRDPATRRDLAWCVAHGTVGLLLSVLVLVMVVLALRDLTFVLWWRLIPAGEAGTALGHPVTTWGGALAVLAGGAAWCVAVVAVAPAVAALEVRLARSLLTPSPSVDASLRVAELTRSRAAALDAHTAELERIERALHDGAQSRVVGVSVMLGVAHRRVAALAPGADVGPALDALGAAQTAAEEALDQLRTVVRGIRPPVLAERGIEGALAGLAASTDVPCRVTAAVATPLPAAVESALYHVAAEGLANVSRHASATSCSVDLAPATRDGAPVARLVIEDDGVGGATVGGGHAGGTGLRGIAARVRALDGSMRVTSPPGGPTRLEVEVPCAS
ncbi:sensor histidine kinase [Isoptericola sp. NPDC057191]|uniref:sensor histidine kinase n=1 Tax=Isoptericola sp. NPDC057191 TaxID=3346041 RepID=UPI00362B8B3F